MKTQLIDFIMWCSDFVTHDNWETVKCTLSQYDLASLELHARTLAHSGPVGELLAQTFGLKL